MCARELPGLQDVAEELGPRGLELVTFVAEGTPAHARMFQQKVKIRVPILLGDRGTLKQFQVAAYPWTLIIDRSGKAVFAIRGGRGADEFKKVFEKYL